MAWYWKLFIATLCLCGVLVSAEGCNDALATVDCAVNYATTVSNLTTPQLMDKTLQCQMIDTLKSCLTTACGSWETVPAQYVKVYQDAQAQMKCGSSDDGCKNMMATLGCVNIFQAEINATANMYANQDLACEVMGHFRTCIVGACGGWERVPQELKTSLDAGKEHGLECDFHNSAGMLRHTAAVWMIAVLSVFVWMT